MYFIFVQVTTTTKTIREIQYLGPDGQLLDYVPNLASGHPSPAPRGLVNLPQNYEHIVGSEYDPNMYQVHILIRLKWNKWCKCTVTTILLASHSRLDFVLFFTICFGKEKRLNLFYLEGHSNNS